MPRDNLAKGDLISNSFLAPSSKNVLNHYTGHLMCSHLAVGTFFKDGKTI